MGHSPSQRSDGLCRATRIDVTLPMYGAKDWTILGEKLWKNGLMP